MNRESPRQLSRNPYEIQKHLCVRFSDNRLTQNRAGVQYIGTFKNGRRCIVWFSHPVLFVLVCFKNEKPNPIKIINQSLLVDRPKIMSRVQLGRLRQLESFYARRAHATPDESVDETVSTSVAPLFSPSQHLRPRAVSFFSPPKGDGLSTVMFREDSPSTAVSRARSMHSVAAPNEIFFSPASHVSSIRSTSPEVAMHNSRSSQRSKNSGIERFSQAHISKCQSPRELQQTIAELQAQGNYPLLVRAAQKRLYQVQQSSACPLIEEEDDGLDMEARISPKSVGTSLVYSYDEERDATDSILSSPLKKVSPSSSSHSRDIKRETELQQTIEQLNRKIVELNQMLKQEKLDYECSIRQIQQARLSAVQHAQTLQKSLAASNQTAENISEQLRLSEERIRSISQQLEDERSAHIAYQQKASQIETSLRRKMQELLQQVNYLQDAGGKTEELNRLLKSARTNFEIIKKERNGIIETILKAMGQDTSAVLVSMIRVK